MKEIKIEIIPLDLKDAKVDDPRRLAACPGNGATPTVDVLTINTRRQAVQQTSDLAIVRHSVKFSTPRTTSEIGRRWRRLLLDEDTCAAASQRLQQDDFARPAAVLPAELAASNLPWSDAELAFIVASPVRKKPKGAAPKYTAQEAETILSAGRTVFHPCRTPASLIGLLSRFWFFEHQAELSLGMSLPCVPPHACTR